jgi:hypothetical protein
VVSSRWGQLAHRANTRGISVRTFRRPVDSAGTVAPRYGNTPHDSEELKTSVDHTTFRRKERNVVKRVDACVGKKGGQFLHLFQPLVLYRLVHSDYKHGMPFRTNTLYSTFASPYRLNYYMESRRR